jgi:hypothetical protein
MSIAMLVGVMLCMAIPGVRQLPTTLYIINPGSSTMPWIHFGARRLGAGEAPMIRAGDKGSLDGGTYQLLL